jgi:hypothetical protein
MLRRLKVIGLVLGVMTVFGLVAAIPVFAELPPGFYGYGRTLPCTDCDLPFAEGVYRLVDINAAARSLGMVKDDVSNTLWAGGTLADLIKEEQADGRLVRDAVDAERYRALSNSDYLRDDRPELCCEDDCCPSACVDDDCSCIDCCDPKKCDGKKPDCGKCDKPSPKPHGPSGYDKRGPYGMDGASYRVTASAGLRLRSGPGTTYAVQDIAPAGAVLKATGNTSWAGGWGWMELIYGGRKLWGAAMYLVPA